MVHGIRMSIEALKQIEVVVDLEGSSATAERLIKAVAARLAVQSKEIGQRGRIGIEVSEAILRSINAQPNSPP